ncbi:hypothetical protein HER32_00230 [Hymenobacter sp. BT18]|uniref:helix-turn-helix domain-containing protein n=1 Tax=Hymenobacter sp. BT18 TaxID=2835648 RepID=UPI00143E391F|nr:helix-turn-helix domain-containing protein [Hymenobacter sp. BT18]QIX59702.1 hypothetical protein HER32_00230 [Hymenobacter sp. BT18]
MEIPSKGKSKSELAEDFGVHVRTLMRWLAKWNDSRTEKIDLSGKVFTPQATRLIIEQFA